MNIADGRLLTDNFTVRPPDAGDQVKEPSSHLRVLTGAIPGKSWRNQPRGLLGQTLDTSQVPGRTVDPNVSNESRAVVAAALDPRQIEALGFHARRPHSCPKPVRLLEGSRFAAQACAVHAAVLAEACPTHPARPLAGGAAAPWLRTTGEGKASTRMMSARSAE